MFCIADRRHYNGTTHTAAAMNVLSILLRASLLLLLPGLLLTLPLSSCGGGGGGDAAFVDSDGDGIADDEENGGGDDASNGGNSGAKPANYLPGKQFFMPKGYTQAELLIENDEVAIHLTCLSASPVWDCQGGELTSSHIQLKKLSAGAPGPIEGGRADLNGTWYQMDYNATNRIQDLCIEAGTAELSPIPVHIDKMDIDIQGREGVRQTKSDSLVLIGTVSSGTLIIAGKEYATLTGASVRLTYTPAAN